ncbi:AlbA family DNA-binding domain-containing protein [Mycolicibacterium sp. A43C]
MEDALGGPIDQSMTAEKVRRIVEEFPAESEFVDFKAKHTLMTKVLKLDRAGRDKWRFERGKDIAAFANARGGVLIFGVRDLKNVESGGSQLDPFTNGEAEPADLEEQFRRAVREVTAPVPRFEMFPVHDGDEFFMVCVVPPSIAAPHAATMPGDSREGLVYPRRAAGESHVIFMREYEVAGLYERRARTGEDRRRRAETVWAEGADALDVPRAPRVWLAVASVPDLPRDDVLSPEVRKEIEAWDDDEQFPWLIQEGFVGVGGYPVPAPGRLCLTEMVQDQDDKPVYASEVRNFYREIHADGSAFAALPLSEPDTPSPFTISMHGLVDRVATATANTLGWTGTRTGLWGATTVTAGIAVTGDQPAVLQIDDFGGRDMGRTIHRRIEDRWPRAVTTVDLADTVTMQGRLVVAHRLGTPLVQAFGAPRLPWLDEDGTLRSFYMVWEGRHTWEDWARHHRVSVNPDS